MWIGLLPASADAAVEGDVEGVQRCLPAVGPAPAATAGGVQADDGQVQVLERGLLVGEVPTGLDRAAEAGIQRLDGVGGGDDGADLGVEGQEGDELGPGVLPQPDDGWVAGLPGRGEARQRLQRGRLGGGGIDRPQILGDGGPVLSAGVAEAVAQQVDVMPTSA